MNFSTETIALLERFAAASALPRVRALHLPRPELADSKQGEFCALELEDGSLGLSYVLLDDTLARLGTSYGERSLAGTDPLALARAYAGLGGANGAVERTLGFAAVNALTRCLFDRAGYVPDSSTDSVGQIDPGPTDHIGMIGLFTSLVERFVTAGARLTVVELKAELAGEREGFRVTLDPAELASCNKVLSTSTILLNDTLDRMLAPCGSARVFAMVGPGAGCLPDALFSRGVTLLGGSWIVDTPGFVDALASGGAWTPFARKFAIDRRTYPGFDALLKRVGA